MFDLEVEKGVGVLLETFLTQSLSRLSERGIAVLIHPNAATSLEREAFDLVPVRVDLSDHASLREMRIRVDQVREIRHASTTASTIGRRDSRHS